VFLKVVIPILLILQHNWMLNVKICYVSPKCNASKLHEGYEWYEYVGYVEACLIKYSNKVHGNFNAKGCRMEMSPINYIF